MIAALRSLFVAWCASWLFLLWSAACVAAGAAAMYLALVAELERLGVLHLHAAVIAIISAVAPLA
jgi:hypothetical protein